jgi:glycosyltransferase involved in cell wall biosynthesis
MSAMKILGNQEDLLVIGDLGQMPAYKQKILEMAKDIEVTFMGLIKNKSVLLNYVRHCILFIFPSYSENMSIMLLEAALMKVPIICSDIDANKAIFNEDEVIFFKSNDSIDLAKKIQYCLDNYQDVLHYSEMAYQKVITLYTWDIIAKRYEYLYNTIIKKKGD